MVGAAETPYDLRFRLLGIPVRVHPLFWIMGRAGLAGSDDWRTWSLWVACVFVSILVHEYGHGLMSKRVRQLAVDRPLDGRRPLLQPGGPQTPRQRLAVVLWGPGAGFVLYGVVMLRLLGRLRPHPRRTPEHRPRTAPFPAGPARPS